MVNGEGGVWGGGVVGGVMWGVMGVVCGERWWGVGGGGAVGVCGVGPAQCLPASRLLAADGHPA